MTPFFSIIVVCLNPGEKLLQTLQSIQKQEFRDYEIVLKDGGSTDGSLQKLDPEQSGLHVVTKPDRGIYDAMNQAVEEAKGRFVFFLNCGDWFMDEQVLADMHDRIAGHEQTGTERSAIYYGNVYERVTGQLVSSNPKLNATGMCHVIRRAFMNGSCFYDIRSNWNTGCGQTMSSFCGAFLKQRRIRFIPGLRWRIMKAGDSRKQRRILLHRKRNTGK